MKTNWQTKKLGDVIKLEYGKPLPRSQRNSNGKYPVYGANGVKDRSDEYYFDKLSIIIGRKGSAGEVNLTVKRFWPLDVTYFVTFDESQHDLRFLYFLLISLELPELARGVKPGINRNDVYAIESQFPSLPEQKRIVAILDKVFADIDKAKENAEKNLANAREIFESYLNNIFSNPGEGWEEKKIGEIANLEYGYTDKAKSSGDLRFIRITDIDNYGLLQPNNKMYVNSFLDFEKYLLNEGDLLMARTGATFGNVLSYKNVEPSVFASYLIRIVFFDEIENQLYWYFSKSKYYWDQAQKLSSGSAQPQFNGNALKELLFRYPMSLSTQKQIVSKLDFLSSEVKELERVYERKVECLEELRKSVLDKAFKGEL